MVNNSQKIGYKICQNTRIDNPITGKEFATSRDCRVIKGSWIGRNGALLSDASDVDIDHIIPLSYAHRMEGPSKKTICKMIQ